MNTNDLLNQWSTLSLDEIEAQLASPERRPGCAQAVRHQAGAPDARGQHGAGDRAACRRHSRIGRAAARHHGLAAQQHPRGHVALVDQPGRLPAGEGQLPGLERGRHRRRRPDRRGGAGGHREAVLSQDQPDPAPGSAVVRIPIRLAAHHRGERGCAARPPRTLGRRRPQPQVHAARPQHGRHRLARVSDAASSARPSGGSSG